MKNLLLIFSVLFSTSLFGRILTDFYENPLETQSFVENLFNERESTIEDRNNSLNTNVLALEERKNTLNDQIENNKQSVNSQLNGWNVYASFSGLEVAIDPNDLLVYNTSQSNSAGIPIVSYLDQLNDEGHSSYGTLNAIYNGFEGSIEAIEDNQTEITEIDADISQINLDLVQSSEDLNLLNQERAQMRQFYTDIAALDSFVDLPNYHFNYTIGDGNSAITSTQYLLSTPYGYGFYTSPNGAEFPIYEQFNVSDLIGKQIRLTRVSDFMDSHPTQIDFLDTGIANAGILDSNLVSTNYTIDTSNSSFSLWNSRYELVFENNNSGVFNEYLDDEDDQFLLSNGTFLITDDVLQDFLDFEQSELFDEPLNSNKWSTYLRQGDDISYSDGKISFIFGPLANGSYWDETALNYSRLLPETESWAVLLNDVDVMNSGADVEIYVLDRESNFDSGIYLTRNNTIEIDIFQNNASILLEKNVSSIVDVNLSISYDSSSQNIIYSYGRLDKLDEVARYNYITGNLEVIDDQFETVYEEGTLVGSVTTQKGFLMGIDVENISKQSYPGDITISSISISRLNSEEVVIQQYILESYSSTDLVNWSLISSESFLPSGDILSLKTIYSDTSNTLETHYTEDSTNWSLIKSEAVNSNENTLFFKSQVTPQ